MDRQGFWFATLLFWLHLFAGTGEDLPPNNESKVFQLIGRDDANLFQRIPFSSSSGFLDRFDGSSESNSAGSGISVLSKLRGRGKGDIPKTGFDFFVQRRKGESSKSGKGRQSKSDSFKRAKGKSKSKAKRYHSSGKKGKKARNPKGKMAREYTKRQQSPTTQPVRSPSQVPTQARLSAVPSSFPSSGALRDGTQAPTMDVVDIRAPTIGPNSMPTADNTTATPTGMPIVQSSPQPAANSTATAADATEAPSLMANITAQPTANLTTGMNTTEAPSLSPNSTMSLRPSTAPALFINGTLLGIPRFFIATVSSGATEAPSDDEFELILNATENYFSQILMDEYRNSDTDFLLFDLELNNTGFELGIPEPRYNLYMEFTASSIFSASSTLPTAQDVFAVLREAINVTYITDVLQSATGTPFEGATEAFYAFTSGII